MDSDIDFNDVFGGPPRRSCSSVGEPRYSFVDSSSSLRRSDQSRNPWPGLSQKPVFGEEVISLSRRNDFFGDIYRGNVESSTSFTPAASRLFTLGPAQPFGTPFPAQFSPPSPTQKEPANLTKYNDTETNGNSKDDSNSSEMGSQFHFSIYKWANYKGSIPLGFAPRKSSDRLQEKDKLQRCSSANGWIAKEKSHNIFRSNAKPLRVEIDKSQNGFIVDPRNEDAEPKDLIIEEHYVFKSESEVVSSSTDKKQVYAVGQETHKSRSKTLNLPFKLGNDAITRNARTKDVSINSTKKLYEILDSKTIKENEKKKASKTSLKRSPRKSWDYGKARVRRKIKEFFRMFNQDAADPVLSENHSSRWKESSIIMTERDEKVQMQKKKSSPDVPAAQHACNGASQKNINSSIQETLSYGSKTIVEDPVDSFEDDFMIEELALEEKTLPQFGIDPEEIKAIDAKIQEWSHGKQGNIRSLLSTLQYVVWSDSGWKAVPLVDIIEGPAVKRSYQKALLCLHPDKLQQKGSSSDKKYTAEKVFNILQDAWTHFNSLGSV